MIQVYVIVDGPDCRVHMPYDLRDAGRIVSGRSWDSINKQWVWPSHAANLVADAIRNYAAVRGYRVRVRVATTELPVKRTRTTHPDYWERVLRATDCDERVYRSLAQSLHPDRGGSVVEMQRLNAARDTVCVGGGR